MRTTLPSGTPVEIVKPDSPRRGVVIVPDIMGLRPLFDDLAARLADEHNWAVAAIEPFAGREEEPLDHRITTMGDYDIDRCVADAVAAADALDVVPVAVIGFCMGGMVTMHAAATGRFDRAVAFYGMIRRPEPWRGKAGTDAVDALIASPGSAERVLAVIGTADPYTPPADVADLAAAGATIASYEGAEHGFVHDASRPAHRADDAADAWRRTAEWLAVGE